MAKQSSKPCCPQPPISIQILPGGILAPSSNTDTGFLLQEDDFFILFESGDKIELEQH